VLALLQFTFVIEPNVRMAEENPNVLPIRRINE